MASEEENDDGVFVEKLPLVIKSPSTVQLLGQLGSPSFRTNKCRQEKKPSRNQVEDDFDLLVRLSKSILLTIQLLRRVIRKYAYGRIGRELQNVSLSVASFERILYKFIQEEILDRSNGEVAKTDNNKALKDIVWQLVHQKPANHAILNGGMASLLRNSTQALDQMNEVLLSLQDNFDPLRQRRKWFSLWSITVAISWCLVIRKWMKTPIKRLGLLEMWKSDFRPSFSTMKKIVAVVIAIDYYNRLSYRFSELRKVKICHSRILLSLRLLLLCQYVLSRSAGDQESGGRLLIGAPMEADIDDTKKNATILLVERVPLPAEFYQSSKRNIGLSVFKLGSNAFIASSGFAYSLVGSHYLLRPLTVLSLPYYFLNPTKASRYATRLLIDNADVNIIKNAWSILGESNPVISALAKFLSPSIPVQGSIIYVGGKGENAGHNRRASSDIKCFLFSIRSIASVREGIATKECMKFMTNDSKKQVGFPQKRNVLLYIHGGGFFAKFFPQDKKLLSIWASKLGALIVYPDFGLSPENHFPRPLEQCVAVYEWILNGGLGFIPDKIVIFGESAGGNIAASVVLKVIEANLRLPDGLLLLFPALTMHLCPSPSRFLYQSDPILPRGILELSLNSYYPDHGSDLQYRQNIHDKFSSPGSAPDSDLAKFPPTYLAVGGLDPLLDDSVDFNTRLNQVNVPGSLKVFPKLTHGFLLYGEIVPDAQIAIDYCCDTIFNILKQ